MSEKITRVVRAVTSLSNAAAAYAVATEHDSMSGTYSEEKELEDALEDLLKKEDE